ncbi:MAG TPA: hypothetical protein VNW25_00050 [Candidatus Sulfotelmatobacter sp.]|jgi:hypothetical protein|nr:hypothetical protein [Candidatus Sulfotelmatobacter sp.]
MSAENTNSEIPLTDVKFRTLLSGYWKAGLRPRITLRGTFSDGTRYAITDQYKDTKFYLVTDLTQTVLSQVFGFDQVLSTFVTQPTSGARRIAVQFPAGSVEAVTLAAGSTIQIKDSTGLAITSSGGFLQDLPGNYDGANDATVRTAVSNVAVQLITAGTLYRHLVIVNAGANQCDIDFANTVTLGANFPLGANLGADSAIVLNGFNGNLWAISNVAGTSIGIFARG